MLRLWGILIVLAGAATAQGQVYEIIADTPCGPRAKPG